MTAPGSSLAGAPRTPEAGGRRQSAPSLAAVIPTHQTRELTLRCLASLFAEAAEHRPEVVVVDDGSTDRTAEAVRSQFPAVTLLRNDTATGFSAAVNRGSAATSSDLVMLLNSDTEVLPGSLEVLRAAFREHPSLGVAGARLLYPDGAAQWCHGPEPGLLWCFALSSGIGRYLGTRTWLRRIRTSWRTARFAATAAAYQPVGWVTGAALAFRREVWEDVGPLYAGFRFYGQDLDFCLRARDAGWEVGLVPGCMVVHHHGATIGEVEPEGHLSHQNPGLLWPDLVHCAERHGGQRQARRTARALAAGARLRLMTRRLTAPLRQDARSSTWARDDRALAEALAALAEARRRRT